MWGVCLLAVTVMCIVPGSQTFTTGRSDPCWYTFCPPGTTCRARRLPCYGWSCPLHAQCLPMKEGFCPWAATAYNFIPCRNQCSGDSQCPEEEKCCPIGRCERCVDAVDSPWIRTVTSESAADRAERFEDLMDED